MDYDELLTRIVDKLADDGRVLGAWLTGSRGRGNPDRYSDIDVWAVVDEADIDAFVADWPALAEQISPTVLLKQVGGGPVFTHVTPDWLRFDISVGVPTEVPQRSRGGLRLLFDRANLQHRLAETGEPKGASPSRIRDLSEEFLRVLGLLPIVVGRGEYEVGAMGCGLMRVMLTQLMLEDIVVEDRGGALRLHGLLPDGRLNALRALPPVEASYESIIEFHVACARLFLPLAKELCARIGIDWPAPAETAVRGWLQRELKVEIEA